MWCALRQGPDHKVGCDQAARGMGAAGGEHGHAGRRAGPDTARCVFKGEEVSGGRLSSSAARGGRSVPRPTDIRSPSSADAAAVVNGSAAAARSAPAADRVRNIGPA